MKFTIDLADFFIFFAEKAYKHNAHNRKADHQKAHEICIINSDVKMSKRIHKLSFFIGLNVNGKKSVIKVKQEDSSKFFIFDEDHQSPDLHPLICKRVDKVKLTAKRTYEIIEHFCTDSEAGQYLPLVSPLRKSSSSKPKSGNQLQFQNLSCIDFFRKFDRETSGLHWW